MEYSYAQALLARSEGNVSAAAREAGVLLPSALPKGKLSGPLYSIGLASIAPENYRPAGIGIEVPLTVLVAGRGCWRRSPS